jgi:hypothetical protein
VRRYPMGDARRAAVDDLGDWVLFGVAASTQSERRKRPA